MFPSGVESKVVDQEIAELAQDKGNKRPDGGGLPQLLSEKWAIVSRCK